MSEIYFYLHGRDRAKDAETDPRPYVKTHYHIAASELAKMDAIQAIRWMLGAQRKALIELKKVVPKFELWDAADPIMSAE